MLGLSAYSTMYINGNDNNSDSDWEKFCRGTDNNIIASQLPGIAAVPLLSPIAYIYTYDNSDGFFQCPFPEGASSMRLLTIISTLVWGCFAFTEYARSLSMGCLPWKIFAFMFFVMWVADCIYVSNGDNFCEEVVRKNFEGIPGAGISIECKNGNYIALLFFEFCLSSICGFIHDTWTTTFQENKKAEPGDSDLARMASKNPKPMSDGEESPLPTKSEI